MPRIRYRDGVRPEDFLDLGQRVWPGNYGLAEVTTAVARTTHIGAWDGDRLVGSVRMLTDGYFLATVSEILVDPGYRRRGIGREPMRRAVAAAPAVGCASVPSPARSTSSTGSDASVALSASSRITHCQLTIATPPANVHWSRRAQL